ncbi:MULTISPECIES: tyrosine-type recombinase/integrase [Mycobacteriaceae]|jgi:site-specific recombinase XerD|uniref:Integrase n=5 Tax=Mycobacteriaceae TaxID=1762 RepID=A0A172UGG0_9MYCO|nr:MULTISPECIES: tyrosine-type recombinase/integrase [Mycobacteriaceae]ANE78273.1 integrase [Mycobacterium adipatum]KMV14297.1 integrase [Mycolicibacterium conceptionense]MDV7195857.1 tyrosine-type recombinase/integrase [Mycolicibacterium fortuitum]NOQ62726.1 tyrosine-type recombinase/integrase [Mycolicibacterium fortuitum]OBB61496.1 integrase [Mycolicibacterium fortuitum]
MTPSPGYVVQRVVMPFGDPESWTVVGADACAVEPVEAFLAHLHAVERSANTVRAYAHDLRDWFTFCARSGLGWSNVRLEDVGRFVAWLRLGPESRDAPNVVAFPTMAPAGCSGATVNRKLSAVSAFYEFHQRHGVDLGDLLVTWQRRGSGGGSWRPLLAHLGSRPEKTRRIRLRADKRLPSTLDEQQVAAVLGSCQRLRDRLLFTLLAETGLRIGEALGLRHEDIDAASCVVSVVGRNNANGARAKSGSRQVPAPGQLIRLYCDYLHTEYGDLDSDYVFVNLWADPVGVPMSYRSVYDLVLRLRARSGIMFSPHVFRHTYATDLLRRGVAVEVVSKLLGHASISTTGDTYSHLSVEDTRRALLAAGVLNHDGAL